MSVWDDLGDAVSDGLDYVKDTVSDFFHDPLETIGDVFEDSVKLFTGYTSFKYVRNKLKPDIPEPSTSVADRDQKRTFRDPLAPREIVYGKQRKGGVIVYVESDGDSSEYLHLVLIVAAHKCESIEQIYFDDKIVAGEPLTFGALDSQRFTIASDYVDNLRAIAHLGGHSFLHPDIALDAPENLTGAHKFLGCTLVYLRLKYDRDVYERGIPQISFLVNGQREIFDPRDDSEQFSRNHALVCLDYLRSWYGLNASDEEIDLESFSAGADFCDEDIETTPGGYTESRYTADGIISMIASPVNVLEDLEQNAAAMIRRSGGKWRYIAPRFDSPIMSLTQSDVIGDISLSPRQGKSSRLNTVKGVFLSPSNNWEPTNYPAVKIDSYIENDREILEQSVDLNFVTSEFQAQRVARIMLEQSRYGLTVSAMFNFKAMDLRVGDRVNFSLEAAGVQNAVFIVLELEIDLTTGVRLTLQENGSAIYTDSPGDRTALARPNTLKLPNPDPIAPTDIQVAEELYRTLQANAFKTRALITWSEPGGRAQYYDLQYRPVNSTNWRWIESGISGDFASIDDIAPGDYVLRIRAINSIAWEGSWIEQNFLVLGKLAPPPNVDQLFIADGELAWNYPSAPVDLAGFKIRYHGSDRKTWSDATALHSGIVTSSPFNVSKYTSGTVTFLIKAVDTSGAESITPAFVTVNIQEADSQNALLVRDMKTTPAQWSATVVQGIVNQDSEIEATSVSGFYGSDESVFYNEDETEPFYQAQYNAVIYDVDIAVDPADLGSSLVFNYQTPGFAATLEYKTPSGNFIPFSGRINSLSETSYTVRIKIPSYFGATTPTITEAGYVIDVEDVTESHEDLAISAGGTRVSLSNDYRAIKHVSITMQTDGGTAATIKVEDKDANLGPLIRAYNSAGATVSATVDVFIRGY